MVQFICRHSLAAHFLIGFFFVGFVRFFLLFLLFLSSISRDWIKWSPSCVWPPFRASITRARARTFNKNCSATNLPQLLQIIDAEMVEAIQFLALSLMKASYLTGLFIRFDACRHLYMHCASPVRSNDVVVECFASLGEFLAEELCIGCLDSVSVLIPTILVLLSFGFSILVAIHCLISRFFYLVLKEIFSLQNAM